MPIFCALCGFSRPWLRWRRAAIYDTDGKVTTNFGGWDLGQSVAIQSDGKIVVAGSGGAGDFALARYGGTPPLVVIDDEPPVIVCPSEITVECDGAGNLAARTAWMNSFTATDNSGSVTLTVSPGGKAEASQPPVILQIAGGETVECLLPLKVTSHMINHPPGRIQPPAPGAVSKPAGVQI